jgi:microcystin-dependent protein
VVDSGGIKYGFVSASSFGAGITTVTVVLDTGVLASPITSVQVGILTPTNSSIPPFQNLKYYPVSTLRTGSFPDYDIRFGNLPAGIGPLPYAGSTIPTGWLECDGSSISRTTYAALFAAIGTTWGSVDGNSFNLPDCRGRATIGAGTGTNAESFTNAAINTGTDRVTVVSNVDKWMTGAFVTFTTGGTPPTTNPANLLDNNDTVYVIRISATEIQFATSLSNAVNGTAIDITAAGSGTFTITQTLTARTLAQQGGEQSHSLVIAELASHTHIQDSHTHTYDKPNAPAALAAPGANGAVLAFTAGTATGGTVATNQNTGGNTQANVMQPYISTKMIISY